MTKLPEALREALDAPESFELWVFAVPHARSYLHADRARAMAAALRWILSDDWTTAELEAAIDALDAEATNG